MKTSKNIPVDESTVWVDPVWGYGLDLPSPNSASVVDYSISMSTTAPPAEYSDIFPAPGDVSRTSTKNGLNARQRTPGSGGLPQKNATATTSNTAYTTSRVPIASTAKIASSTPQTSEHSASSAGQGLSQNTSVSTEGLAVASRRVTPATTRNPSPQQTSISGGGGGGGGGTVLTPATRRRGSPAQLLTSPHTVAPWEPLSMSASGHTHGAARAHHTRSDSLHSVNVGSPNEVRTRAGSITTSDPNPSTSAAAPLTSPTFSLGSSLLAQLAPVASGASAEAGKPSPSSPRGRGRGGGGFFSPLTPISPRVAGAPSTSTTATAAPPPLAFARRVSPPASPGTTIDASLGPDASANRGRGAPSQAAATSRPAPTPSTVPNTPAKGNTASTGRRSTYPNNAQNLTVATPPTTNTNRNSLDVANGAADVRYSLDHMWTTPSRQLASAGASPMLKDNGDESDALPRSQSVGAARKIPSAKSATATTKPTSEAVVLPAIAGATGTSQHSQKFPRVPSAASTVTATRPFAHERRPLSLLSPLQITTPAEQDRQLPTFAPVSIMKRTSLATTAENGGASGPIKSDRSPVMAPSSHTKQQQQKHKQQQTPSKSRRQGAPLPATAGVQESPAHAPKRHGSPAQLVMPPASTVSPEAPSLKHPSPDGEWQIQSEEQIEKMAAMIERRVRDSRENERKNSEGLVPRSERDKTTVNTTPLRSSVESGECSRRTSVPTTTTASNSNSHKGERASSAKANARYEVSADRAPNVLEMIARLNSGFSSVHSSTTLGTLTPRASPTPTSSTTRNRTAAHTQVPPTLSISDSQASSPAGDNAGIPRVNNFRFHLGGTETDVDVEESTTETSLATEP